MSITELRNDADQAASELRLEPANFPPPDGGMCFPGFAPFSTINLT